MKKIDRSTAIGLIFKEHPESAGIFMDSGMFCVGCSVANKETLEEGCEVHGVDCDEMISKLNKLIKKK